MKMHINTVAKKVGCSVSTIHVYIAKLSHITVSKGICYGITQQDIDDLFEFYYLRLKSSKSNLITERMQKRYDKIVTNKKARIIKKIEQYLQYL